MAEYFMCDCGSKEFLRIISLVKNPAIAGQGKANIEEVGLECIKCEKFYDAGEVKDKFEIS